MFLPPVLHILCAETWLLRQCCQQLLKFLRSNWLVHLPFRFFRRRQTLALRPSRSATRGSSCLAKDPDERYQTIRDVAIELKEVRRELKDSAGRDTTVPPTPSAMSGEPPSPGSASSAESASGTRASSAEYIVAGIGQHKIAVIIASLVLAAGAIAVFDRPILEFP